MTVLSKSKILAFKQCPKRLWLEVHARDKRKDSNATRASFDTGHKIGEIARRIFVPEDNGILLNYKELGLNGLIAATPDALVERKPVFEAGFQANGALALADILLPVESADGPAWHMVEVKSSAHVHDYHRIDAAVQYSVATAAGLNISKVSIAHVDNGWTYRRDKDYQGLLKLADITNKVAALIPHVPEWLSEAHKIVELAAAPERLTGSHCRDPYECGFLQHCTSTEPKVEHPVTWLPRVQAKALKALIAEQAVTTMEDVPDDLLNDLQLRVKACTLSGELYFDAEGARADLAQYTLPAYFLDFETIYFAIPIWKDTRPYEQIPFQFSCHVMDAQQRLTHKEFLLTDGSNPIRPFAEALVTACGADGPIYVYNKGFEGSRIDDLFKHTGDDAQLSAALLRIKDRLVDLMPIAQARFYHPRQEGSWSIKKVLPAMFPNDPEMDYSKLEGVQDGGEAQQAFLSLIGKGEPLESADVTRRQLLKYCQLDTYAMVRIMKKFTSGSPIRVLCEKVGLTADPI